MFKIKRKLKRIISIMCVLTLLVQTLIVSANDVNKSEFQLAIEAATYTSTYADSENADMALATATKQVQAVISARTEANENTATFVVNNPVLNINAKGGTYTFSVTVTSGDGSSSFTTDTLTMNVSARPEPLKVVFDDQETVDNAHFYNCMNRSLVTEGGKTFMRAELTSGARPLRYSNFVAQSGLSVMDFDQYPYMKISWKNNDVLGWSQMFIYYGAEGMESSFYFNPYGHTGQDTDWKEMVFDMRTGEYTFLKGSAMGGATTGTATRYGAGADFTGEGLVNICLTNQAGAFVGDIEYIAFFGSKAEAEAYPVELGNLKTMLEDAEYTATYKDAESVEKAIELVTPQVQAVIDEWTLDSGETATFTIQNGELSRYSKGGTFTFDVTVTEADSAPYDVSLTMAIGARPQPLVVTFDNQSTVDGAHFFNCSNKSLVTEGDKTFMRAELTSGARPLRYSNFVAQSGLSVMDFDQYPYMKISWKNNDVLGWSQMFIYYGAEGMESSFYFNPYGHTGQDTDWKEMVFDMRTGEYTFLKGSAMGGATTGTATRYGAGADFTGEGLVNICLTNQTGAFVGDIEYIAFFATKEEAEAYPNNLGSLKYQLENAEYTATYAEAQTLDKATDFATDQVQAVIDAWTLDIGGTATFTIKNGQLSHLEDGGTFTFDVTVTEADVAPYDVSLTMTIDARLKPLAVVFDDQETVNGTAFIYASNKNLVTEGGKTFMRVEQTATARPLRYTNFATQSGVSTIDYDKYPYMRISLKNNDILGNNYFFIYYGGAEGMESSYYFEPYKGTGQDTDWKEILFDMRTGEYTFLKGSGFRGTTGFATPYGAQNPYTGEGPVNFVFSNSAGAYVGDIEYIAFFATKEEAEAYPSIKESTSILSSATFSCESDANFTEPKAHSEITEQIAALELPAAYTLENGVYVAPTATATGSYSVDVVFTATGDRVAVTLQIAKTDRIAYFEELTIDTYRSGDKFSYPESKEIGYIFAGWYDVETEKPIADTVTTGQALAKFVDANVLKVKVQPGLVQDGENKVVPDDNASLRFVTTVDDVDYKEVAFMISLQTVDQGDGTYTYTDPKSTVTSENAGIVYEKLYYVGMSSGDTMQDYVPSIFSSYAKYFKTYTLSGIPGTAYDTNIRVTPYWETLDGTTVYGQTRTITVNEVKAIFAEQ